MKIVVDARSLLDVQPGLGPTGVGRWTAGVVQALSRAAPDWEIELVLVHRSGSIDPSRFGPNVSFRAVRVSDRWQRRLDVLGLWPTVDRFVGRPDVVIGPGFITWRSKGARLPVIHDLTHVKYPQYMSPRNLWFMRSMLSRSIRRASLVLTVSQAMAEEIRNHYRLDDTRVEVVPNGYDESAIAAGATTAPPAAVPTDFLLFVGTKEPRKNLIGALKAYGLAANSAAQAFPKLVVVGGRGWRDSAIEKSLEALPGDSIIDLGYVPDDALFSLYHRARALLFPSYYEGFGLPVLEAMASGCPVITSRVGGISEVAGEAAVYVDPDDVNGIAAAITDVLERDDLQAKLRAAGLERARSFTWDQAGAALKEACLHAVDPARI